MNGQEILKTQNVKEVQHEIKNYFQAYAKRNLGKAAEYIKIMIVSDLLIIRCEGY